MPIYLAVDEFINTICDACSTYNCYKLNGESAYLFVHKLQMYGNDVLIGLVRSLSFNSNWRFILLKCTKRHKVRACKLNLSTPVGPNRNQNKKIKPYEKNMPKTKNKCVDQFFSIYILCITNSCGRQILANKTNPQSKVWTPSLHTFPLNSMGNMRDTHIWWNSRHQRNQSSIHSEPNTISIG